MNKNDICGKCGAKLPSSGYCLRCGYNNIENYESNKSHYEDNSLTSKEKRRIILSLLNLIFIVPIVFYGGIVWMLFGKSLENNLEYIIILMFCIIYFIVSLTMMLSSVVLLIKKSRK